MTHKVPLPYINSSHALSQIAGKSIKAQHNSKNPSRLFSSSRSLSAFHVFHPPPRYSRRRVGRDRACLVRRRRPSFRIHVSGLRRAAGPLPEILERGRTLSFIRTNVRPNRVLPNTARSAQTTQRTPRANVARYLQGHREAHERKPPHQRHVRAYQRAHPGVAEPPGRVRRGDGRARVVRPDGAQGHPARSEPGDDPRGSQEGHGDDGQIRIEGVAEGQRADKEGDAEQGNRSSFCDERTGRS